MTKTNVIFLTLVVGLLAACGGGGGSGMGAGTGGGGPNGLPVQEPDPPAGAANTYVALSTDSGTSTLGGAVLAAGESVAATSGTITHSSQSFTASGIAGPQALANGTAFDLSGFTYATDVEIDAGTFALVGVATLPEDVRSSGSAAYSGTFAGQLVDASQITATTLDWDADIQISFAGSGDVDMTFQGGGSDLIDTIRILNAGISGNGLSGGTMRTFKNGVRNDITGTSVDMNGSLFGYDAILLSPAEVGGAIQSQDADTDISGLFLTRVRP